MIIALIFFGLLSIALAFYLVMSREKNEDLKREHRRRIEILQTCRTIYFEGPRGATKKQKVPAFVKIGELVFHKGILYKIKDANETYITAEEVPNWEDM
jgi:hypothetical protein